MKIQHLEKKNKIYINFSLIKNIILTRFSIFAFNIKDHDEKNFIINDNSPNGDSCFGFSTKIC